ncbi:uncharacterized protein LOC123920960 isoform X1 [Trifolium pratense]|uniref:uncharacterized protein LOC123920960 isoform X1 n=1 Tax=Trifolium pratense TaxID=57577 RepID=UPI001E6922D5|nr:uncharacterized protein LOC123920960 isoform X1 [Trifolium pratense]
MIAEKMLLAESGDRSPSPPTRHESWKRARQTKDGSYTSTATQVIADKIVFDDPTSLTEEELYELRNSWATCFLDLYNPEVDYDVADDEA